MKTLVADNLSNAQYWVKSILPTLNWKKSQVITIKEYRNKRSTEQNSFYFMWITALANYLGYDKEVLHEAYARKYLPWVEKEVPGELSYWERGHSPKADTLDFCKYMENIHNHAFDFHGFFLPYPDDPNFKTFAEQYKYISKGMEIQYS